MAELRWILLAAGIALILGLWWWETRKARARPNEAAVEPWPAEGSEHAVMEVGEGDAEEQEFAAEPEDVSYSPTIERVRIERRPPLIEIPEDMEVDVSDFVGIDRRRGTEPEFALAPDQGVEPESQGEAGEEEPYVAATDMYDEDHRAPWVRTQPLERDEVAPKREEEPPEPPMDLMERRTAEASQQRIVALRLVATGGHWNGAELRAALEAEALEYGPYSIFHRAREDGKTLFYVASMMEPGSFDLSQMDEMEYPGISLFGVVPGPLDAPRPSTWCWRRVATWPIG